MKKFSQDNFAKAKHFVKTHGRKLDIALLAYYFEDGLKGEVLSELATYQNPDGGFGHALEPDFRLPASSALATSIGFQYLKEVKATAELPLVQNGIQYFLATYDSSRQGWRCFPPQVNDYPRAPWWNYNEDATDIVSFAPNPSAEIIGYLNAYSSLVPADLLASLTQTALDHLLSLSGPQDMSHLFCYIRMAELLPQSAQTQAFEKLTELVKTTINPDPTNWHNHCAKPLWFVSSPQSPLAEIIRDEIEVNLDYEIEQQDASGCWLPNWSWGQYEDTWLIAEQEWKGEMTVKMLKTLSNFGRIEGK